MMVSADRDWSIYWGCWLLLLLSSVFFFPNICVDRGVLLLFLVPELLSARLRTKKGTLSHFMQWIDAAAGPNARWWQSWSALVTGLLLMISWQAAYVAGYGYDGPWSNSVQGVIAGFTVFFWNVYHWLHSRRYG